VFIPVVGGRAMAEHVLAVAPQRFSIAGQSLGGWVAQEVAARAPERVSKLFLCDTLPPAVT
jgi:pimeloyl-ACP methyl ester carboxylesterase